MSGCRHSSCNRPNQESERFGYPPAVVDAIALRWFYGALSVPFVFSSNGATGSSSTTVRARALSG